jgi:hypothetical protein
MKSQLSFPYLRKHLLILTILVITAFALFPRSGSAYANNYTHAILNEHFVATYCPTCTADEPLVNKAYQDLSGSLIIVSYHIQQWSTDEGNLVGSHYGVHTIPYHVIDGGYVTGKGRIGSPSIQDGIESAGKRSVHRIGLALEKTVQGNLLSYVGSVQELDRKPFSGYVRVFILENGLMASGKEWNRVLRAFGVNQSLNLQPDGIVVFSGNWTIPSYVNLGNVSVAAGVFDSSTTGPYGSYAVQAVDDTYSGQVIPETLEPTQITAIAVIVVTAATIILKKRSREASSH